MDLIEQTRAEGLAEGLGAAIGATMVARGMALTERGRARLAACSDVKLLTAWVTNAVTAATEADVFATR